MKKIIIFSIFIFIFLNTLVFAKEETLEVTGTVIEATKVQESYESGISFLTQDVKVKIDSGDFKDKIVLIKNHMMSDSPTKMIFRTNDRVLLQVSAPYSEKDFYITDYVRTNSMSILAVIFCVSIIIIGGIIGLKSLFSLAITMASVFFVFIPLTLKGINPLYLTIILSVIITFISIFIISGINHKSITAIVGTICGVIIAGIIPIILSSKMHLTGLTMDEASMLFYIPQGLKFKITDLLYSGIILGSLGAIMDVAMSISSSMEEIYRANPSAKKINLIKSGLNVGRDIMGTMTNTLILAYTGSSLPLLLIFYAYNTSFLKIINLDIIATEVVRSLSGSIGIILCVPLTVFASTFMVRCRK